MPIKIADLRKDLTAANAQWTLDHRLRDEDEVKVHPTGADLSKVAKAADLPKLDLTPFFTAPTNNTFLLQQRINRGFIPKNKLTELDTTQLESLKTIAPGAPGSKVLELRSTAEETLAAAAPAAAAEFGTSGTPKSVDWRNRYGWPWLTKIKDQGPCESCWTFSAVGLVEAMTRIEHAVWSLRSEGDVHDGLGAQCSTTGSPVTALDWMKAHGVADPGCWPYETTNQPYHPTSDRDGRTVRLDNYVAIGNIQDQKNWLDNVGPLSACFTVYNDFFAYGPNSGVYTKTNNTVAGGHCIVIVGYDDSKNAWLIRNSWGTGWGMQGYCWFGYGQADIDSYAKYGIPNAAINPDPWTKRRMHNGSLYESGDGAGHRNFEVWTKAPTGNAIRHYWRDGSNFNWSLAETLANDCQQSPTATGTTYNRNFEYVYWTTSNRLHHWWFNQSNGTWNDGGIFGPTNVAGIPGFIQGDYGAPGNFELVVRLSDGTLQHWWRNNGGGGWAASATFASNVAHSGATLVQRRDHGLDVVCVNNDGTMQRYWRDDPHGGAWKAGEKFGAGVKSSPVMVEGQYSAADETKQGNYELCVAVNGSIQHWWRDNEGTQDWFHSATFGSGITKVLGLIESSYGFNLELIAELTDGTLQHWWRSGATWNQGPNFGHAATDPLIVRPIPVGPIKKVAIKK
ncbi:MAG TPA: C1 family peptidase [Rickettsiales bacterium]|nr:C1 family peptidase [Rickettsiales bacterium]